MGLGEYRVKERYISVELVAGAYNYVVRLVSGLKREHEREVGLVYPSAAVFDSLPLESRKLQCNDRRMVNIVISACHKATNVFKVLPHHAIPRARVSRK